MVFKATKKAKIYIFRLSFPPPPQSQGTARAGLPQGLTWSSEALSRCPLRLGFQESPYPSFWCPRRRRSGLHSPEGSATRQGKDSRAWNHPQHILEELASSLLHFTLTQQPPPGFGLSSSCSSAVTAQNLRNTRWDIFLPLIISNCISEVRKALLILPTSSSRSYFKQP